MTENLEIHYIFDCDVIERNGKQYANVIGFRNEVKYEDCSFKFESDSIIPSVTKTINQIVNDHWKLIFVEMETQWKKVINKIARKIFKPIFDQIPIQDFFE